jgi:hypothetical protein
MRSLVVALAAVALSGCANPIDTLRQSTPVRPQIDEARTVKDICYNTPVPPGWIQTSDYYSPVICGGVSTASNVLVIERHTDKPIGTEMNVCASSPTPAGWIKFGESYNPAICGQPSYFTNNYKAIRKIDFVGFVKKGEILDQCQDGAKYLITLEDGSQTRLRAVPNSSAESDLKRIINSNGTRLSVNGTLVAAFGDPACNRIDAVSVNIFGPN